MGAEHDPESLLERQMHAMLRSLPPRPAPEGLTARVLEELSRRAALPWWRRQVTQWPMPARLSFALVAAALVLLSLAGSASLQDLAAPAAPALSWSHHLMALWSALLAPLTALLRSLPPLWLEIAAALAACAYLFLFGVGAAAYRLLYLER
jgi:hypothetical protein